MSENIFTIKNKYSKTLKDCFNFKNKNKPTWLIILNDDQNIDFLLEGLEILSCDFVIKTQKEIEKKLNIISSKDIKKDLLLWFDFVVWDNDIENLQEYFKSWITPIVPQNNYLSSILKEFDPISSEWNSFVYTNNNKWSIYYAIIRYLENYKFPYDNRNLIKNITWL